MANRRTWGYEVRYNRFSSSSINSTYIRSKSLLDLNDNDTNKIDKKTLPLNTPFPAISHFFTRLTPTYRKHAKILDTFLKTRLKASRERARLMGMFLLALMVQS
jgi:hypothetical protein